MNPIGAAISQVRRFPGKVLRLGVFGICMLGLVSCESAEQVQARQTQFNGQPVTEVIARIGPPVYQDQRMAMWSYRDKVSQQVPIQVYRDGRYQFAGYRYETRWINCTFVALLDRGRVRDSRYSGNACLRYAPKL